MWFPLERFKITDRSMEPALSEGDHIIVNRLAYIFKKPKVGEIIVFKHPSQTKFLVKRISKKLKENSYLVIGDNKAASSDSRTFGPIKIGLIVGKVSIAVK